MKKSISIGAALLGTAALAFHAIPSTHAQNENQPAETPAKAKSDYKILLAAAIPVGAETFTVEVMAYGQEEPRLFIRHGRARSEPPTRLADLQVTLIFKDGHTMQPALFNPGPEEMIGLTGHGTVTESTVYVLKGIPVNDLSAVQIVYRKQASEKTPFHTP